MSRLSSVDGLLHRLVVLAVDLVVVVLATVAALVICDDLQVSISRLSEIVPYITLTIVAAVGFSALIGSNRSIWRFSYLGDYLRVIAAAIGIVAAALTASFMVEQLDGVPRALPVVQLLMMIVMLVGVRVGRRLHHERRRSKRAALRPILHYLGEETVLLVGVGPLTELYLRALAQFSNGRVNIAGVLEQGYRQEARCIHSLPILGPPEEVVGVLKNLEVHGVVIDRILVLTAFEKLSTGAHEALRTVANETATKVEFLAEKFEFSEAPNSNANSESEREAVREARLSSSVTAVDALSRRRYFAIKRVVDIIGAVVLGIIILPLGLLIALAVALDVGTPILFWQRRPGKAGRPFRLYKFRTMGSAYDVQGRKLEDELRVSIIGHFLRRTRLDEIPQLYNILIGNMSFIGPRPLLPVDQSPGSEARLLVRPGLTGLAQVAGGRAISARDKAALDISYIRNASFVTDVKVVSRTVPLILFGERPNPQAIKDAWRDVGLIDLEPQTKP